jgi:hypothetical protein
MRVLGRRHGEVPAECAESWLIRCHRNVAARPSRAGKSAAGAARACTALPHSPPCPQTHAGYTYDHPRPYCSRGRGKIRTSASTRHAAPPRSATRSPTPAPTPRHARCRDGSDLFLSSPCSAATESTRRHRNGCARACGGGDGQGRTKPRAARCRARDTFLSPTAMTTATLHSFTGRACPRHAVRSARLPTTGELQLHPGPARQCRSHGHLVVRIRRAHVRRHRGCAARRSRPELPAACPNGRACAPGSAEGVALMRVLFNFTMLASAAGAAGGAR